MGLFNSISNKIANAIGKKKSVKLTNYGQQRVKEYKAAGIDTSKKISSPLPQTSKSIAAEKKDQKKSSSSKSSSGKSSSSKSSSSKSSSNKSSNKSSNTLYTLTNPFATQKAYASTGSLASSNAPSMGINSSPNGAITTPMTSSIATSSITQPGNTSTNKDPSSWDVAINGVGPGAWKDSWLGKILNVAKYVSPLALLGYEAISKERLLSEKAGGNVNSVQEALNIQPQTLTPEGQQKYKEATEKATELGYVKDDGTPDTNAYLEDIYRVMTSDLPTDGGTPAPAGALAGTVTQVGSAWDPNNMPPGDVVFASLKEGATAEQAAAIDAAIAEYDRQRALLQNQLTYAGQQRENALTTYGNQYNDVLSQIANAKTNAERDTAVGRQNVFDVAQQTQRSNRNVLRSLGILSSSAAGEMLNKPYTEASKQVGSMENQLVQRKKELDDLKVQKDSEFATNVKDLENNYSKMISDIQADIRYTEADKIAAINQLTAAAQTRYAELEQAQLNWNNQLAAQQQQFALDIARLSAYSGITPEMSGILQNSMAVKV